VEEVKEVEEVEDEEEVSRLHFTQNKASKLSDSRTCSSSPDTSTPNQEGLDLQSSRTRGNNKTYEPT